MKNIINLANRDYIVTQFVKINDDEYSLLQEYDYPYGVTGTLDDIIAVDPPGGPYITRGYKTSDGYMVTEIKNTDKGIIFKLKKINENEQ